MDSARISLSMTMYMHYLQLAGTVACCSFAAHIERVPPPVRLLSVCWSPYQNQVCLAVNAASFIARLGPSDQKTKEGRSARTFL